MENGPQCCHDRGIDSSDPLDIKQTQQKNRAASCPSQFWVCLCNSKNLLGDNDISKLQFNYIIIQCCIPGVHVTCVIDAWIGSSLKQNGPLVTVPGLLRQWQRSIPCGHVLRNIADLPLTKRSISISSLAESNKIVNFS